MANTHELGIHDPALQEQMFELIDSNLVVYIGETAASQAAKPEYFALVMRPDEHKKLLEARDDDLRDEFLDGCDQMLKHMNTVPSEDYVPLIRLTDEDAQWQPEARVSGNAQWALDEAALAINSEHERSQTVAPVLVPSCESLRPPVRLRQSRSHYRR